MGLFNDFVRVTRSRPCPVCEKPDWCLVDRSNPQDPAVVICQREPSPYPAGEAGYKHFLRRSETPSRRRTRTLQVESATAHDFPALAKNFQAAITVNGLARLASSLGLTAATLQRLGTGWASFEALQRAGTQSRAGAWTFQMCDSKGNVIGIRLRSAGGFKYAVNGSRQGLFTPSGLAQDGPLFIAEGPSDCGALLDLGIDAIGRPSCSGGSKLVIEFIRGQRRSEVIVIADADGPGLSGARALADRLTIHCKNVRVLVPPNGCNDARDWRRAGATREEVMAAAEHAERFGVMVTNSRKRAASHV